MSPSCLRLRAARALCCASLFLSVLGFSALTARAQLQWNVFNETTSVAAPASNSSSGVAITVPAGQRATLYATNFVPVDFSAVTSGEVYVTINFKTSGGLSSIGSGTRAVGFGLYNNGGTNPGTTFADDNGYFTWLNGRATGSLIELRRRNAAGASPSLLNPTGTAFNSLGTGTTTQTSGSLTDGNNYAIQLHLIRTATGVSLGNTSSTTTGAGIWVSGTGLSQTAYTNPDVPPATTVFNEIGFMFLNSTAADVTLTVNSVTGLTAINPPAVTTQPASIVLNPTQSGSLTVVSTGTAPLSYQWKKDNVDIVGATSATYAISSAQNSDAGSYTVAITNAYGNTTSNAATVSVTSSPIAPVITAQPASLTVNGGQNATFTVAAYGSSPIAFQWKKDNVNISGATTASLALTNVGAADAASYTVVVSNGTSSATSDAAVLTVLTAPSITTQPVSVTSTVGANVSFTVVAAGAPFPAYQWARNGVNITGATSATLTLNNITLANTGVYTVRVSNSVSALTSNPAVLAIPSTMTTTSVSPSNSATAVNIDTPLSVTFDRVPVVGTTGRIRIYKASDSSLVDTLDMGVTPYTRAIGTQTVQFIFYPIIVTGNTAAIYPHAGVLTYGQTYYVTMEQSVILDSTGASFTGISDVNAWRFTTKSAGPASNATAVTVAADGSGDFSTVQGAIDFVPLDNTQRVTITVKKGTYTEINYVGSRKPFITIQGEDRAQTILQYANNNNFNTLTGNNRAMFSCDANDFILRTITLHNLTPLGGSQAEAFRANALRTIIDRVNLLSFQDTLLINGTAPSAFVTDSYIEGDVDYMWGSGVVYFQRCELKALNNGSYYTQIRNVQTQLGNIYVDCRLTRAPGVTGCYLGRIDPNTGNFPYSQCVWINCAMDAHILPEGWLLNNATTAPNIKYWEYKSTDLTGASLDVGKRISSSKQIDDATAAQYRDPAFVLNGWNPQIAPTIDTAPSSQSVVAGSNARLSIIATGAPQPTFQWFKDGATISVAASSTLVLPNVQPISAGSYTVKVTNASGNVTSTAATLTVTHGSNYGAYFGTIGSVGNFALFIRDNGSGVFLGRTSAGGALLSRTVQLDGAGHANFVLAVGPSTATTTPDRTVDLTINGSGAITGTLGAAGGPALTGTRAAATGVASAYAGYYQLGAGLAGASTHVIVAATGQAYVLVQKGASNDAGAATVDFFGRITGTTAGGQTLNGLISPNGASSLIVVADTAGGQGIYSGTSDSVAKALRLDQFSSRARATTGDGVTIVGFVITGDTPVETLIRAVGPTLSTFGVSSVLTTPKLDLYRGSSIIATNTGWGTGSSPADIVATSVRAGAFALPAGSADSALHITLAPGLYTAIMSGATGGSGVGLVEIYDLTGGTSGQRLFNLSARANAGSGDNTLIAGVDVIGNSPKRVLVRAVGPSLAQFGVAGVLAKPVLSLYQGSTLIVQNSGLPGSADAVAITAAAAEINAFPLLAGSADAALLVNLAPGLYTAQVTSADGGTGIALIEIYEVP